MKENAIFTIVASNYIGMAKALAASVSVNCDVDFYIFVADSDEPVRDEFLGVGSALSIPLIELEQMRFKYNLVEFCTSVKPFCFEKILNLGHRKVVYLDPDIMVTSTLDYIFDQLESRSVVVTPHRLNQNVPMTNRGGVFNLGFLGVRDSVASLEMLAWWGERLKDDAVIDPMQGVFTDQKWMDSLPVVLPDNELGVLRHPGCNFAPWNVLERELIKENGSFAVRLCGSDAAEPLLFTHFSAIDFRGVSDGKNSVFGVVKPTENPAIDALLAEYGMLLAGAEFSKHLETEWKYARYDNGKKVLPTHRRMYRRLLQEGFLYHEPFDSSQPFYDLLKRSRFILEDSDSSDEVKSRNFRTRKRVIAVLDYLNLAVLRLIGSGRYSLLARYLIRYLHVDNRVRFLNKKFRNFGVREF